MATAYGKRKEEEEEEERKNEERKWVMEEEQWAEERMKGISEEEEVEVRVRAAAEGMKQREGWAAFEEKRTRGEGMRKESIDLREARVTRGRGRVDVEKPEETKREEAKKENKEAAARLRALVELDMRSKAVKQAKEGAGEEKKDERVEEGWGEEPTWHVSGMTGGHTKREMWKRMLMPGDKGGKYPKTKNVVARYLNTNRTTFTSKNKIFIIIQRRHYN